jgi:hypothetical protein
MTEKPKILTAKALRAIMPRLAGWKLANNKLTFRNAPRQDVGAWAPTRLSD